MKIKIDRARYHRNGSFGEGFSLVEFRYRLQGERRERRLMGVVFDEPGQVAVIEPANPLNRWQGDNFEPALRAGIVEADRNGSLFDHSGADNL